MAGVEEVQSNANVGMMRDCCGVCGESRGECRGEGWGEGGGECRGEGGGECGHQERNAVVWEHLTPRKFSSGEGGLNWPEEATGCSRVAAGLQQG